jgi:hypothetical protein
MIFMIKVGDLRMGVTVETWVVKDPSKAEEQDQFFMKWLDYVCSVLGSSAPWHRYYAQRNPVGGRVLVFGFGSNKDEQKFEKLRTGDKTFAKFRDEWFAKYDIQDFIVRPCDEIMQDTIKEIENKYS